MDTRQRLRRGPGAARYAGAMSDRSTAALRAVRPAAALGVRRLGTGDLPALLELYRRRAAWLEQRGIDQWRLADAAPAS
jgi:hypothetical protein